QGSVAAAHAANFAICARFVTLTDTKRIQIAARGTAGPLETSKSGCSTSICAAMMASSPSLRLSFAALTGLPSTAAFAQGGGGSAAGASTSSTIVRLPSQHEYGQQCGPSVPQRWPADWQRRGGMV